MDRLMIEYLRKKGMGGMNEQEFMSKFKDFMTKYRRNSMRGGSMRHGGEGDFMPMGRMDDFYMKRHGGTEEFMDMFDSDDRLFDRFNRHGMEDDDMYKMMRYMRHSMNGGEHFNESEAKYLVSECITLRMVESTVVRSLICTKQKKFVRDIGEYSLHL